MAQVTGVVEAVGNKFGKFSVLINETWYGTKEEWAPTPRPDKGDTITFDDGGSKFLKKCKIVGAGASAAASPAGRSYSNVGVEVGHASNLAMRVVERMDILPGSDDMYKAFIEHTLKIHRVMSSIRKKVESGEASSASLSFEREAKAKSAVSDSDEIVGDVF